MKRIRFYNAIGLLTNLAIIAFAIMSYVAIGKDTLLGDVNQYARFDVVASFMAIAAAVFMSVANIVSLIKGETRIPALFTGIYFTAAVMTTIALVVNICFPKYNGLESYKQLFSIEGGYLYYAFLIPVICIFNFLFISIDKKIRFASIFVPFGATIIYIVTVFVTMIVTKNPELVKYPFFHIIPAWAEKFGEKLTENIIILLVFIAVSFGVSLLMWMVNRISHRVIFGSDLSEFEEDSKGKKGEKKGFVNYLKDSVAFKTTVQNKPGTTYHISYHNRKLKTWKVKGEEYERALKVFDTQKKAIDYAKALVAKNGGSIRVHSMVGKIRKD